MADGISDRGLANGVIGSVERHSIFDRGGYAPEPKYTAEIQSAVEAGRISTRRADQLTAARGWQTYPPRTDNPAADQTAHPPR